MSSNIFAQQISSLNVSVFLLRVRTWAISYGINAKSLRLTTTKSGLCVSTIIQKLTTLFAICVYCRVHFVYESPNANFIISCCLFGNLSLKVKYIQNKCDIIHNKFRQQFLTAIHMSRGITRVIWFLIIWDTFSLSLFSLIRLSLSRWNSWKLARNDSIFRDEIFWKIVQVDGKWFLLLSN